MEKISSITLPNGNSYDLKDKDAVTQTRTINGNALSSDITLTASDVGALASDGTAVKAGRLAAAHIFNGAAGWYAFFSRTLVVGGSVDITLLVEDSYNRANGILRLYSGRASGGAFTGYINWLSVVAWSPTDVRFLYDSSTAAVTLYVNKLSNNNGRLVFRVLSAVNRNGEDITLTDNWLSTSVSEPTTATAATQRAIPAVGSVTLTASWSGSGPYTQTVTVTGPPVTGNSKIDLQPTAAQISSLIADGVTGLTIENNSGTLTAYAVGAVPSAAMTVQCTVEETV